MNLLHDPLFRVLTDDGREEISLPELLEALGTDRVHQLVGIQRHQADAFHVFLTYLAGAVLVRNGDTAPVQTADYWRAGLFGLSGPTGECAWELVVEDGNKPAFMQPPLKKAVRPSAEILTPDKLDLLQTAKNHDIKQNRAQRPFVDEWIYALISLQTMSGFMGQGNQGISRMNSGFGNRPIVELVRDRSLGGRWRDAVRRLLLHRQDVLEQPFGFDPNGLVLIWTEPWDGEEQFTLADLDPFYIEICRRIRFVRRGDELIAQTYSAKKTRIAAKELNGVVGDPWLPVELAGRGDPKALTVSPNGLTAELMRRILFGDELGLSKLQAPLSGWSGPFWLTASVLVRGQGTTDGFYEWEIMIPRERVKLFFGGGDARDSLADLSRLGIAYAGTMQNRVLKPAIFALLQGGPSQLKYDDDTSQSWWSVFARKFERRWSQDYFAWLLSVPDRFDKDAEERRWAQILTKHALSVLEEAEKALPSHTGRRYRGITALRNRFWSGFYAEGNFGFMRRESVGTSSSI